MRTRAPFLVGRSAEIYEVERALGQARAGSGGSLFLVGEAGIGKSRLTAEAVSRAIAAEMVVLRGRGSTIGPMVPFRPLAEAVLSLARRGELPADDELGLYRGVLGALVPDWAIDDNARGGVSLVALAEGMLRLTSAVGRDRGCLLVLEDLHDVDVETLAVIEYLIDNLGQQTTLLLGTMRAEAVDAIELVRRQDGAIVDLDRLRKADVVELIGACLSVPPAEVPPSGVELLWQRSAGNPLLVEELLHGMVSTGQLARGPDGWRMDERIRVEIPATVRRSIALRTDRLAEQGRVLLWAGAVVGPRFPLSIVQRVVEMDDHVLFGQLHILVEAQLLAPDERGPDWYAFQHPLIAEAMLDQLTPADRARFSRRAGEALELGYPGLPGEWCQLAATLWLAAGEPARAATLFTDAGRRALADGAAGSAISLLERAEHLLTEHPDPWARAEVLETLLYALAEAGELERAVELAGTLGSDESGLDAARRVAIRVRLAWGAHLVGRWEDGMAQVAEARAILGSQLAPASVAAIDSVAAHLSLDMSGQDRLVEVEVLARSALAAAERESRAVESCQAMMAIGIVARERDLTESIGWFDRMAVVAQAHRLAIWHLYARSGAATSTWLAEGDVAALVTTSGDAVRAGVVNVSSSMDAVHTLHLVMCGEFDNAAGQLRECLARVRRLHLEPVERYLLMTRAVLHAHQGNRPDMERSIAEFRDRGGDRSRELTLVLGMARACCALLEDNTDLARRELDAVV
ncbi:MAG TPA: AAA family ATPase, partial [Pseudonocardiaceae bacterium]|nr:AAA family ATPase [Pseudonocardiaceae bacterium]